MSYRVSRTRPDAGRYVDGTASVDAIRSTGYMEPISAPLNLKMNPVADEGSYFTILNPTPGTGVAGHAAPTTMDNTKPFLIFQNSAEVGGRRVYLDYIKLVVTAAGTGGTLNYATHLIDSGAGYTSGGSALTPVSVNGDLNPNSVVRSAVAGAAVATANASTQRVVAHQTARTVIPVVGDVLLFQFGQAMSSVAGAPLEGTLQLERIIQCPPVIVAPQQWYKLVLWRASQSAAASYELEVGYWER